MNRPVYSLSCLTDPRIFALGRMAAFSDHETYADAAEAATGKSSLHQSLNGIWKFRYTEWLPNRPVGFEQPDCDCSAWDDIPVPAHMQLHGYGKPQYTNVPYPWDGHETLSPPHIPMQRNPVGSYVRMFTVPEAWLGKRVVLTFHGVETAFFCWVNGMLIGYAEDSFTPSHFDITQALHAGANKLAVEVFRYSTASYLEDQDFWRFSGIFRDVELQAFPAAHVHDLFVHATPDESLQKGLLRVEARLDLPENTQISLCLHLTDGNGNTVLTDTLPAVPELTVAYTLPSPKLWSAEQPNLYTLALILTDENGAELEVARTRVGFRRFELKDGLMQLNGKRILFRGVDRHEFNPERGRCITHEDMLADIRNLKRCNINAVRTSHYPNQSLWYRLCDEYGIYLIDETNLETHATWAYGPRTPQTVVPDSNPEWLPAVLDRAQSLLERDKNHPSVLLWSCGNESHGGRDIFEMSEFFHRRDPERLVHYEGIYGDRRYPCTSDVESQMYTPAAEVKAYLAVHKDKPFLLCEYAHAMGNSVGALHKYTALEDECPQYQGGFIWDFIDQALWTTAPNGKRRLAYGGDFGDRPTDRDFCGNGLFFADRTPTPRLQEVAYLYQPIRLTPDASGVTVENRCLFTNADVYTLRWQLRRDGMIVQKGQLARLPVGPGETSHFALPISLPQECGEYVLHCGLHLRAATLWASPEDELMHGETLLANMPAAAPASTRDYAVTRGAMNIGAQGENWEMLFSFTEGGLCSLQSADGFERLITAPALSLYRAPTNNDLANHDFRTEGLWLAASQLAAASFVDATETDGLLTVRYRYNLPLTGGASLALAYTVLGEGRLRFTLHWDGRADLPDMEAFGLSLRLPCSLCNVSYYGLGPDENYPDRKHGACLGRFTHTAAQNLTPYLQPQECGNREGVRTLSVTDAQGHGLRVDSVDTPLSISVLPHSAQELSAARHQDELAPPTYTYLDVALCRKGVGGDNTWGAPVHPEYHISSAKSMTLAFVVSIL